MAPLRMLKPIRECFSTSSDDLSDKPHPIQPHEVRVNHVSTQAREERIQVEQQDPIKVLLHPTEVRDPYYIGDIYDDAPLEIAKEWGNGIDLKNMPYLSHIKSLCTGWPHFKFLSDFMEVGTTPLKWIYIKPGDNPEKQTVNTAHRKERAERTNVACLDFLGSGEVRRKDFTQASDFEHALETNFASNYSKIATSVVDSQQEDAVVGAEQSDNDSNAGSHAPVKDNAKVTVYEKPDAAEPASREGSRETPEETVHFRLLVVEDLSRSVIEALGARFDLDPSFFRSQILDYAWFNVRDRFRDPPSLDFFTKQQDWFLVRWVRAQYFKDRDSFEKARAEANRFNVFRRPDDDLNNKAMLDHHGAVIGLTRTRASYWQSKSDGNEAVPVGILLLDPTIQSGKRVWNYSRNPATPPSMHDKSPRPPGLPNNSLFEEVIHLTQNYPHIPNVLPPSPSQPMIPLQGFLHLLCAEWLNMSSYLSTRLGQLEWEISEPKDFRLEAADDSSLRKLHHWRRLVPLYLEMLGEAIDSVFHFPPPSSTPLVPRASLAASQMTMCACTCAAQTDPPPFYQLKPSFERALEKMKEHHEHVHRLMSVATAAINIAESRMSYKENRNISRLSWLATIFIPLTFMTGLFSIQPNIPELMQSFKYFFAAAIPLAVITVLVAAATKESVRLWVTVKSSSGKKKTKDGFQFYGREAKEQLRKQRKEE